ncbi:hypothetical protein E3Q22_02547, partial [Wallemia mellicola]
VPLTPTSIPSPTTSSQELYQCGLQYPPTPKHQKSNSDQDLYPPAAIINQLSPPTIKLLGIPNTGAKSRVETQIKIILQLENIENGPWEYLRLPYGSASKKRSKRGALLPNDVPRQNTLYLETRVKCATSPNYSVYACTPCRDREKKRSQRKREARRRPRPKSEDEDEDPLPNSVPSSVRDQWERNKIILFNCGELVTLNTESVFEGGQALPTAILPTRITCYCRHHREKLGFIIDFTLKQHDGSVVASTRSPPILITDDHKSTTSKLSTNNDPLSSKPRKIAKSTRGITEEDNLIHSDSNDKKPYARSNRRERTPLQFNHVSSSSPSFISPSDYSANNLNMTTPSTTPSPPKNLKELLPNQNITPFNLGNPFDDGTRKMENTDDLEKYLTSTLSVNSPPQMSENQSGLQMNSQLDLSMFDLEADKFISNSWNLDDTNADMSYKEAKISRVVPYEGPTSGGIEITILGKNFTDGLVAYFGENPASKTTRWGESTLVCLLPPSLQAGPVDVTLKGPNSSKNAMSEQVTFTYLDQSDKALMELALKVLGYNLTGKVEDAKNVAMRIVGAGDEEEQFNNYHNMNSTNNNYDLETFTLNALKLLDYNDGETYTNIVNNQRQTLLHLSCQLSFDRLATILIRNGADLNARDINGLTPLHFAHMFKSEDCASVLYENSADPSIVDATGKLPKEVGNVRYFTKLINQDGEDADDEVDFSSSEESIESLSEKPMIKKRDSIILKSPISSESKGVTKKERKFHECDLDILPPKTDFIHEKTEWGFNKVEEITQFLDEIDWSTKAKRRAQSVVEDVRLMLFWAPVLMLSLIFSFISIIPFMNRVGNQLAPLLGLQANSE